MSDFDYAKITSFGELRDIGDLYELMVDAAPAGSTLVEIGCYHGRSLIHLGTLAKKADKGLKVIGVENGTGMPGVLDECRKNIQRSGLINIIRIWPYDSLHAATTFNNESIWFAFLDASHTPHEAVADDIKAWMSKVAKGGYLGGHDYRWFTVCEPVNALIPIVLHDPAFDDCWLSPKQELILDADIHLPTTIPKNASDPTITQYLKSRQEK